MFKQSSFEVLSIQKTLIPLYTAFKPNNKAAVPPLILLPFCSSFFQWLLINDDDDGRHNDGDNHVE